MKLLIIYFALFALVASSNAQEFNGTLTADILHKWGFTTDTTDMNLQDKGIQKSTPLPLEPSLDCKP